MDVLALIITGLLSGSLGVAIVALFGDRWKFEAERKAKKEDREEEKKDRSEANRKAIAQMQDEEKERNVVLEERLELMQKQIEMQTEAIRLILYDRLVQFGEYLINKGEITFDQRHRFGEMYKEYHEVLKGNGDADFIRDAVNGLAMKYSEGEKAQY